MSTEHLHNQDAIEKLQELVSKIDIGMMASFSSESDYPYVVPMSRQEVDDDGHIWYLFSAESHSYQNFQKSSKVTVTFADTSSYSFLAINGVVTITSDQERIDKYWNKFMEVYFEKGREDPAIRVLEVTPIDVHYWDTKSNKLVTLLKVATGAILGQNLDIGREGELNL